MGGKLWPAVRTSGGTWPLAIVPRPWGVRGDRRGVATEPLRVSMSATITRRLVSLSDAADALAVSTLTVCRYITDGQVEAVRPGRKTLRIKVDSIERFIDVRPVGNWP